MLNFFDVDLFLLRIHTLNKKLKKKKQILTSRLKKKKQILTRQIPTR